MADRYVLYVVDNVDRSKHINFQSETAPFGPFSVGDFWFFDANPKGYRITHVSHAVALRDGIQTRSTVLNIDTKVREIEGGDLEPVWPHA